MDKYVSGEDLFIDEMIEFVKKLGDVLAFGVKEWVDDVFDESFWVGYLVHS